ncbi:hypothetical protein PEPS_38870 (plasmid) [Persicobacter psychrovividus]|uniref:DUF4920 domain-containing protein n=2 Tax=Persicobacter psychrovividus TaxID=387638 RepID=A0ABM7VL58_9BACT|nr:hypothetical protein PEPS_38870 [Persicobacter psychrovividus]
MAFSKLCESNEQDYFVYLWENNNRQTLDMLRFLIAFSLLIHLSSCNLSEKKEAQQGAEEKEATFYGTAFDLNDITALSNIEKQLESKDSLLITTEGTIAEVCQKKGCWMTLPLNENDNLLVRFKDYAFFVPKDAAGKKAIMHGVARKQVISVATLKHYAEDAGKSAEEIAKITEDEIKYTFQADGVTLK